jgi:hypothetical protein
MLSWDHWKNKLPEPRLSRTCLVANLRLKADQLITVFCFAGFIGIQTAITSLCFSKSLSGKATDMSIMVILNNFKDLYNCYHINDY